MTFNEFKKTVEHFRNDIIVSKHGEYCDNKSKTTLGIIFINNGKQSKVYNYRGTYGEVLAKLKITEWYTDDMIENLKCQIERLEKVNGRKNLFGGYIDNTNEIVQLKADIERLLNYYRVGKR